MRLLMKLDFYETIRSVLCLLFRCSVCISLSLITSQPIDMDTS